MKYFMLIFLIVASFPSFSQVPEALREIDLGHVDRLISSYQFDLALIELNWKKDSLSTPILQRKGYCYYRLGNYNQAIIEYNRILAVDSTDRNATYQLAQLYSKNDQFDESAQCYNRLIAADSSNSFYYKQYAVIIQQSEDILKAIAYYLKAVELNPRDVEAYVLLGNALLEDEQYELADSVFSNAVLNLKNPQLRLLLAKAQLGAKKYDAVIQTLEPLLLKDTTTAYARLLGISYFQLDRFDKVIPWMNYLLNNNLKAEWIYYYMGVSYEQLGKSDTAISFLNKAIEEGISDNISTYYTQLAMSYENMKDFKSAIKYFKAAYESSKSDILLYHLARNYDVYYKDKAQAIAYYKRYLSSDDTIKIAKEYSKYRLDELSVYR